jgi:predicted GNAT family N-acyltransferase
MIIRFRKIDFKSTDYESECALRDEVLRRPLGLSLYDEDLSVESGQLHFGLFDTADVLRACVIAVPVRVQEVKIRQMAVQNGSQGQGLGRRILHDLEENLAKQGVVCFGLHARKTAIGFYEKLAYAVAGDEFVEVGVPHVKMCKVLTK